LSDAREGSDSSAARAVAAILAAASDAVGRPLANPRRLSGSAWSVVLRCTDADGATVVVKAYPVGSRDGPACFAAESAGLATAGGTGLAPRLLGVCPAALTVVMSDLGTGPSLADVLLGRSAPAASAALLSWARSCGALAAATGGRHSDFETARSRYLAGRPSQSDAARLLARIGGAGERIARVIAEPGNGLSAVPLPAGLEADLSAVVQSVAPPRYPVFSPGDLCPDNNLIAEAGIRFLDFESADLYSVFLDAAYLRMPFSTCWCAFRLPAELAGAAESAYREEVVAVHPALADDEIWSAGVRGGVAAWSVSSMYWLLDWALERDRPLDAERESPGTRQLMRHRWRVLAGELQPAGEFPALARLAQSLLAATERWQAAELPLYPAFRSPAPASRAGQRTGCGPARSATRAGPDPTGRNQDHQEP
jgi:hypothetical protein